MEDTTTVKGIQYLVDESGERVAAVINLKEWGELWEDFFDVLVSESRSPTCFNGFRVSGEGFLFIAGGGV